MREISEYKIVKKNIIVPLVIGIKSSPWVSVGKKLITIREIGTAHKEKFLHVLKTDSLNLKIIIEKIKTGINNKKYIPNRSLRSPQNSP